MSDLTRHVRESAGLATRDYRWVLSLAHFWNGAPGAIDQIQTLVANIGICGKQQRH